MSVHYPDPEFESRKTGVWGRGPYGGAHGGVLTARTPFRDPVQNPPRFTGRVPCLKRSNLLLFRRQEGMASGEEIKMC